MMKVSAVNLPVIPGNAQHIGARSEQQDSFGFSAFDDRDQIDHAGVLSVVADGMGGLAMGQEASAVAVRTFLATYAAKAPEEKIASALDRSLHAANRAVNLMARDAGLEGETGTTLVAVVVHDGLLYRVAAGDSRIYLYRAEQLRQITTDYNYGRVLDRMVAQGNMQQTEAAAHPSRAALTSYLGKAELDEYDKPSDPPLSLLPGDKILLASDGLFGFLPEEEFVKCLVEEPQQAAEDMVRTTIERQRPYQDNVTVAILGYGLPVAASLPDTQTRRRQTKTAITVTRKQSATGKWLTVAAVLLVLAAAGYFGGQYFGGLSSEKTQKTNATVPEQSPDKTGYRDTGATESIGK